jgi:hypothetical protein
MSTNNESLQSAIGAREPLPQSAVGAREPLPLVDSINPQMIYQPCGVLDDGTLVLRQFSHISTKMIAGDSKSITYEYVISPTTFYPGFLYAVPLKNEGLYTIPKTNNMHTGNLITTTPFTEEISVIVKIIIN